MAIEAVTQASELKGIDVSQLSEFYLRDVHLDAALLVPENGAVEVLFSLRPARLNSNTYHENLYDFTITSVVTVTGSDTFTEHSRGQVGVRIGTLGLPPPSCVGCAYLS